MLDEPAGRWLLPDREKLLEAPTDIHLASMTCTLGAGRIETCANRSWALLRGKVRPSIAATVSPKVLPPTLTPYSAHADDRVEECG